jgi:hypothetical protein
MFVKALQAVALYRLGKHIEALQTVIAFKHNTAALGNEDVLLFSGWILLALGCESDSLELFDAACKRHPESEDVHLEAFCHFIRLREWKRMQQVAMKLHKIFVASLSSTPATKDSPSPAGYLWWCVMSMLVQARDPSNRPSIPLLLSLCERLISDRKETTQASEFYVRAKVLYLRATGSLSRALLPSITDDFEAISFPNNPPVEPNADSRKAREELLRIFHSPEGNTFCDQNLGLELWRREIELDLGGSNDWRAGLDRCRMLLVDDGDTNWATVLGLIHFSINLQWPELRKGSGVAESPAKGGQEGDLVKDARQILRKLTDGGEKGPSTERGFLLGLVELERLLRRIKEPSEGSKLLILDVRRIAHDRM